MLQRADYVDHAGDQPLGDGTLTDLLDRAVARWGARVALDYAGVEIGYDALKRHADRLAAALLARGIGRGRTVALLLPNTPWHPIALFAVLRTGARLVMISPLEALRERMHKLRDSDARLLITTDLFGLSDGAQALREAGAVDDILVALDGYWSGTAESGLPEAEPPSFWPAIAPDDIAALQYTGGTTGLPKGAMLTHGNLSAAVGSYRACSALWDPLPDPVAPERMLAVLPLFHIYALTTVLLRPVVDGATILLRPRFDPATTLHDIAVRRVSLFPGVPTMWIALLNHPDAAGTDFSSLKMCVSGGAPLPFEVQRKVEALIGVPLFNGWGMTETAPAGTRVPPGVTPRPGLIGLPLPGVSMRIVAMDDASRVLGVDEIGEIAIQGPNVFAGYWNKPEATKESFRDGYFLTGDLGAVDQEGLFTIVGRRKNMLICSGFNVYPAMIEGAIYEHPDVAEAIVIGIDDAYRGQSAKAFVTLKPGADTLTLDALKAFLKDRLGAHEMPAALELRDALPRSPAGKLLASVLEAEERAKAGDAA
jgi:long-chain acyl-CoA synthetase